MATPNVSHTVPIPCPKCGHPTSIVVYRHFDQCSMLCRECEHSWSTDLTAHTFLKNVPLFTPI